MKGDLVILFLLNKTLDTCFLTILIANPSAIADFPTPGFQSVMDYFFYLLDKICDTLSISSFLPMTGSTFPSSAYFVISLLKLSKIGVEDLVLFFCLLTQLYKFSLFPLHRSMMLNRYYQFSFLF